MARDSSQTHLKQRMGDERQRDPDMMPVEWCHAASSASLAKVKA